jgi:hypothetical protein
MLATVLHGKGDIRCEEVAEPKILKSTDANDIVASAHFSAYCGARSGADARTLLRALEYGLGSG